MVTWALLWYAAGLVGHSLLEVVVRAFYALHDTRTPVSVTLVAMLLNIGFSLTFPGLFEKAGWLPLGGLALANSLATALECTALIVLLRRRLGGMQGSRIWSAAVQASLGAFIMGAALWGFGLLASQMRAWIAILLSVALGAILYGLMLAVLRVPEFAQAAASLRRRWAGLIHRKAITPSSTEDT